MANAIGLFTGLMHGQAGLLERRRGQAVALARRGGPAGPAMEVAAVGTHGAKDVDPLDRVTTQHPSEEIVLAGRYRLVRKLGEGGMGSVWLAEDETLDGREVALKTLPPFLAQNARAIGHLREEAKLALRLSHPHIATLRGFEEDETAAFLVMDYVDGGTLDDLLCREGPLSVSQARGLFALLAEALDYAHGRGVIHRDIKPSNILIAQDGTPYLSDFGIGREIKDTATRFTGTSTSGTLPYMSPEQLRGERPTPAQDIYSFAATIYEALTGDPPFCRGEIAYQIENVEPEPLPESGDALTAQVMRALSKTPERRPGTAVSMLDSANEGTRPSPPPKSRRRGGKERGRRDSGRDSSTKTPGADARGLIAMMEQASASGRADDFGRYIGQATMVVAGKPKAAEILTFLEGLTGEWQRRARNYLEICVAKAYTPAIRLRAAILLLDLGSWQKAKEALEEVLRVEPENSAALTALGEAFAAQRKHEAEQERRRRETESEQKRLREDAERKARKRAIARGLSRSLCAVGPLWFAGGPLLYLTLFVLGKLPPGGSDLLALAFFVWLLGCLAFGLAMLLTRKLT